MTVRRVVVFKANQLGDSLVNLPVVESLVGQLGSSHVGVLTTPIAEGLYANLMPEAQRFVAARDEFNGSWKRPGLAGRFWRWLSEFDPDAVLIPFDQGSMARLLGRGLVARGRNKVIVETKSPTARLPDYGTRVFHARPGDQTMHECNWDLYRNFAEIVGWPDPPPKPPRPQRFLKNPPIRSRSRVMIHPGSSREATRWGFDRFIELGNRLADAGAEVLWIPEGDGLPPVRDGIEIVTRRPLMEFARLAAGCGLFIGNNSGPMHLCDALGVPMVVLCGPVGHEWDPYWSERRELVRSPGLECQPCEAWGRRVSVCPRTEEPFACMSRPGVDEVFRRAMAVIGGMYPEEKLDEVG